MAKKKTVKIDPNKVKKEDLQTPQNTFESQDVVDVNLD